MRRTLPLLVIALAIFLAAPTTFAAAPEPAGHGDAHAPAAGHGERQPVLAESSKWPGVMLIIIGGIFLAAAVIGPVVRAEMAHAEPPPHGHGHGHGHDDDHAGHGTSDHGHHH